MIGELTQPIVTDASFCHELCVAGIAFCFEDGKLLGTEIVSAHSANHAEALAVIRSTSFLAGQQIPPGQIIKTDSLMTVRTLADHRGTGEHFFAAAVKTLRRWQEIRGFELHHVDRSVVAPAHAAAWHTLRAWKIGAGHSDRWKPTHPIALPDPEPIAA